MYCVHRYHSLHVKINVILILVRVRYKAYALFLEMHLPSKN